MLSTALSRGDMTLSEWCGTMQCPMCLVLKLPMKRLMTLTCTWLLLDIWVNIVQINGTLLTRQLLFQALCKLPGLVFWLQSAHIYNCPNNCHGQRWYVCCMHVYKRKTNAKGERQVSDTSGGQAERALEEPLSGSRLG